MKITEMSIKDLALLLTAYEKCGGINYEDFARMIFDNCVKFESDDLYLYNEYLSDNKYDGWFTFDELDDILNGYTPLEVIRMTQFGNINWSDDYVTFDGYGNLVSASEYSLIKDMNDDFDFFLFMIENADDGELESIFEVSTDVINYCRMLLSVCY